MLHVGLEQTLYRMPLGIEKDRKKRVFSLTRNHPKVKPVPRQANL